MRSYETVLILRPDLTQEQMEEEVKKTEQVIKDLGGKDVSIEHWGRREIAFELKKVKHGWYVGIKYSTEASDLNQELSKLLRINDSYLKFQTHKKVEKVRGFKGNPRSVDDNASA